MSDYTATLDDVRLAFAESVTLHTMEEPHLSLAYATFDQFIARVRADALREAGREMRAQVERATEYQRFTEHELIEHGIEQVLSEYADRIEGKHE